MAEAKSGDYTTASGVPAVTSSPTFTSNRVTGPEIGAITWVEESPLNSTVPVTSSEGRKVVSASVTIFSRARWASVTLKVDGLTIAVVSSVADDDEVQPATT